MLIDWFTVIAELVNFLILVWLLKRFLYEPVLKAIDEREKKIASELQHAADVEKEAESRLIELQRKNEAFDNAHAQMIKDAEQEAVEEKRTLLNEAHREYDALRMRLQETLKHEETSLESRVTGRISAEVFSIARKVLQDLSGSSLEAQIADVFCQRLRESDPEDVAAMKDAVSRKSLNPLVRSTFPLSSSLQERIQAVVRDVFSIDTQLRFEEGYDMVGGIELSMNGHSVSWSVRSYLDSLEKMTAELLEGAE